MERRRPEACGLERWCEEVQWIRGACRMEKFHAVR